MSGPPIDLSSYLERIELPRPKPRGLPLLETLHRHHLARIPFENIDVRLGRGVSLDLGSLQTKLVKNRRGGYCFEHNTLSAAVLRALDFHVSTLEARVRPPGATTTLPRTHMVLRVDLDGDDWLYDVGFGGDGPLLPVPFDGTISEQSDAAYRIAAEPSGALVLQRRLVDEWSDLYAISPTPALPVDYEVANHYTATHPTSIFRRTLTVQRSMPDERRILRNETYIVRRGAEENRSVVPGSDLAALLVEAFDLDLPQDDIRALSSLRD